MPRRTGYTNPYAEYLENTLGRYGYLISMPSKEKLESLLRAGANINSYFSDSSSYSQASVRGSTLLAGLVRRFNDLSGKNKEKCLELIQFAIIRGADVNAGRTRIDEISRKPVRGQPVLTPLEIAISTRSPTLIRILLESDAELKQSSFDTWVSYFSDVRSANEYDKLFDILKLLLGYGGELKKAQLQRILSEEEPNPDAFENQYKLIQFYEANGIVLQPSEVNINIFLENLNEYNANSIEKLTRFIQILVSRGLELQSDQTEHILEAINGLQGKPQQMENLKPLLQLFSERAPVSQKLIDTLLASIRAANRPSEREHLRSTLKLVKPSYKNGDEYDTRPVPHDATNAISYADIEDGDLLYNINNEYLGTQGKVGEHSHFYKVEHWNEWEKQFAKSQRDFERAYGHPSNRVLSSPYTQLPVTSKVLYRAAKMPAPTEGGTRKKKRTTSKRAKTSKRV